MLAEIAVGGFALNSYHQRKKALGANTEIKVSKIDKSKVILDQVKELKYYWELTPNEKWEEQPEWLGYKVSYHTNSDGLREEKNYSIEKPASTFRIITLGDSFTYGQHVNTDQNWTEILEKKLNNVDCGYNNIEVINLGMGGFDVRYIVKRYQEIGAKYNPDLVIWFESDSGFTRFHELIKPLIEECDADESIENEKQKKEVFHYCWVKANQKINASIERHILDGILYKQFELFFNTIEENKVAVFYYQNQSGFELQIIDQLKIRYPMAIFKDIIPNRTSKDVLLDGHPSPEGHKVISDSIYNFLLRENKLQCQ